MLKLVATDLDGTLLHSDGTITARTRSVLDAVESSGVTVVFVTGRPIRWMDDIWAHVGHHGLAICSNGGIVYDVSCSSVTMARSIERSLGLSVTESLRTAIPGTSFAVEKVDGFGREPAFLPRMPAPPGMDVGQLGEILDDTVVKLLARSEALDPERFWAEVEALVGHLVTTTWSSAGALVEMSGPGVSKASTLQLLCDQRGIEASEVVAFGDMPNDLPLLEWVGSSYAMANAHPSVRALADHVAPANDEDGVAAVLERLFL